MNKYQEALEEAKIEYAINTDESEKAKQKAYDTLQELVDRATPKKVVLDGYAGKCPICNKWVRAYHKFCPHCGQSLEWEEGEKK